MSFAACIPIILQSEGGYVDNPRDPGGPPNLGVTLDTLSGWLERPAAVDGVMYDHPCVIPDPHPAFKPPEERRGARRRTYCPTRRKGFPTATSWQHSRWWRIRGHRPLAPREKRTTPD